MQPSDRTNRRSFLRGVGVAAGSMALGGCDALAQAPWFKRVLASAEVLTMGSQNALLSSNDLAAEYTEADLSPQFKANGSTNPRAPEYRAMVQNGFADWRLEVGGLVDRPLSLSLADLRAMPPRTQITRHDCVEGWSCIAEWTGVQLSHVLSLAGLRPEARFVYFRSMDTMERSLAGTVKYWESHDLRDSLHPQTILAYGMIGAALPVRNGAPLRLRVERQLGYKMAKYLTAIEVVADLTDAGSYWATKGYDWYAGI